MSSLSAEQVALQLDDLKGWGLEGNSLIKTFEFADFASAMGFITHVAFHAQALEEFPAWTNQYNIVSIRIGDANQPAVRGRDVQLAKRIEGCYHPAH